MGSVSHHVQRPLTRWRRRQASRPGWRRFDFLRRPGDSVAGSYRAPSGPLPPFRNPLFGVRLLSTCVSKERPFAAAGYCGSTSDVQTWPGHRADYAAATCRIFESSQALPASHCRKRVFRRSVVPNSSRIDSCASADLLAGCQQNTARQPSSLLFAPSSHAGTRRSFSGESCRYVARHTEEAAPGGHTSSGSYSPSSRFKKTFASAHCSRSLSSMASSTQDTSYQQLNSEARSYISKQQLGAYIDGHWIAHDADPSRFPQRLLQLLQQTPRNQSHDNLTERQPSRQRQQQGGHAEQRPMHSPEEAVPASALSFTSFEVRDPATGESVCSLPALDGPYVRAAVNAAARAQHTVWGHEQSPPARRHHLLQQWEGLVQEEKESLARVLVLETGKPLPEARGEIQYACTFIKWFAEQLRRDNGVLIPSPSGTQTLMAAYRQPIGVCALITPWNMPAAMLTRKAAAALAAGCCCICKLPMEAPLTALCMGRLAERAGIPAGVLNLVTTDHKGARVFADEISRQAIVRKISFTGSTRVGRVLMQQAALTMKRISLELGGNAPFIIFDDADIDEAVQALVACKFRNAGQTCVCANRVYVHRDIWDTLVPVLVKRVRDLAVGHGFDPGVSIGPLISRTAREKVERLVAQAVAVGGRLLCPVDAAASVTIQKEGQGSAAVLGAAEQLLHAVRSSLPEHLRGDDSNFFPPVVMDCRAFDGTEMEALRSAARKEMHAAPGGQTAVLRQSSSRAEHQGQAAAMQARQEREDDQVPDLLQTEIFGPVLPLYSFSEEADVIKRANTTRAGLAAYVCTRDLYRVARVTGELEAGLVGVNTGIISTVEAPFGGVKESGTGREGSVYGLDEYTELKYVCIGGGPMSK